MVNIPLTIACNDYDRTPLQLTNGVDLQPILPGETLVNMLREGKLDALFTARALVLRG